MIEVLYSTGLRVSELVGLRVFDVDMRMGCLRCIGKGDKEAPGGRLGRKATQRSSNTWETGRPALIARAPEGKSSVTPFLFGKP